MRTQNELGRQNFSMKIIINDSANTLEDELIQLDACPEMFINNIYTVRMDEMSDEEIKESIEWISNELKNNMR